MEVKMKKTMINCVFAVLCAVLSLGFFMSCASGAKATGMDPTEDIPQADRDEADRVVIVDWADRTLGEISAPTWLRNMSRGNSTTFKEMWGIDSDRIVKLSMARGKTEATAQALSRAGFAYSQAAELTQKVIGRVGQGLNDVGELEALYVAASETKAEISGLREEAGFWQKVRTTKAGTNERFEDYIYYTVYSMDQGMWDALCRKYLEDVTGGAGLETATKQQVMALYDEMKEDSDKMDEEKALLEEAQYNEQMKRIENIQTQSTTITDSGDLQVKAAVDEAQKLSSQIF